MNLLRGDNVFGKKNEFNEKINTLIGENTTFKGKIKGKGAIRIDGEIEGDVEYEGDVILGSKGKINGNVYCNNITISGIVIGNIECKSILSILDSGKLIGDINVNSLIINENAVFEGLCKMNQNSETKKIKSANKKAD